MPRSTSLLLLTLMGSLARAAPGWDVIVIAGQSNSIGRSERIYLGAEAQPPVTKDRLPLALLMPCRVATLRCTAGRGAYVAERMQSPSFFDWQRDLGIFSGINWRRGSIGPAWEFVQYYVATELQGGRSVLVVPASLGATSISRWVAPTNGTPGGDLYQAMASMILHALAVSTPPTAMGNSSEASAAGSGSTNKVVAVLWCQGESDDKVPPSVTVASASLFYRARLWGMIAGIRSLPGVLPTVPFVSAEPAQAALSGPQLGPWAWQLALRAYAYAYLPAGGWPQFATHASSMGLRTFSYAERDEGDSWSNGHSVHLDEASLRELGRRWFRAWRSVARQDALAPPAPPRAIMRARWRLSAGALILDVPHVAGPLSSPYWRGPDIPALVRLQLVYAPNNAAVPPAPRIMMWSNSTNITNVFPGWLPGGGCPSCSNLMLSPVLTFTPYRLPSNTSRNPISSTLLIPGTYASDLSLSPPAVEVSVKGAAPWAYFGNASDSGDNTLVVGTGAPRCGGPAGAPAPLLLSTISSDLTTLSLPLYALCMPPLLAGGAAPWCTNAGWVAVVTPVFTQPRLVSAPEAGDADDLSEDGSRRPAPGTPPGELGLAMQLVLGSPRLLRVPGSIRAAADATLTPTRSRTASRARSASPTLAPSRSATVSKSRSRKAK